MLACVPAAVLAFAALALSQEFSNTTLGLDSPVSQGPWSEVLEEWTLSQKDTRQKRIMKLPMTHGYYVTNRNDPVSHNEWSQMYPPSPPSPGKIVNRPSNPYGSKPGANGSPPHQLTHRQDPPQRKEVSETDLYLLGAIEKLVYRVDFMEKRLKKVEETLYYVMVGNQKNPDPCPKNFSRVGSGCYSFEAEEKYDWKTSNLACKKKGAALLELETLEEYQSFVPYLQATKLLKGKDYWTGGLNPGLLWIWSNSAKPVTTSAKDISNMINGTTATATEDNTTTIHGSGRCLKLSYNPALRGYAYLGNDCAKREHYVCELPDKTLSNEIDRISKETKVKDDKKYIPVTTDPTS